MTALRKNQSGAITLIGALFVVVVLSVMAVSLLRMASSNILDSAVQNDAVEALFVAETGVEHASYLYANTANCAGLAGVGPVNAGRGSFTLGIPLVQPAVGCRVRVTASVSSAGNDPAVRTIDADLRLSGSEGWIVGGSGTILGWDGTAWNVFTSPTTNDLYDVHCSNVSNCKAVGAGGTVIHWDGNTWSSSTSNTTFDLFAVSCEPDNPNNCFAAGGDASQGVIQYWDGLVWAPSAVASAPDDSQFNDLSCPSTICYAVMDSGDIDRYNPGTGNWSDDASGTTVPMNGIDCTADNDCLAVGDTSGNNWNYDVRDSGGWTPGTLAISGSGTLKRDLNAVSCINTNDCWAAAERAGNNYLLGYWNGSTWSPQVISGAQRERLNGVHCLATDDCWAVGDYRSSGNVLRYDGSNWSNSLVTVAADINLYGVHFHSGGGGGGGSGAVTLIRWEEIIGN